MVVVCDIRGELSTDGYWELFWICPASTNISPISLGITNRQKFSRHIECDTAGHSGLPLITKHLKAWVLLLENYPVNLTHSAVTGCLRVRVVKNTEVDEQST